MNVSRAQKSPIPKFFYREFSVLESANDEGGGIVPTAPSD